MAWLLLACSALFWAGNFVVGRLIAGEIGPITMSLWRWSLALAIIIPFAAPRMWRQRALIRQHIGLLVFLAIFSVASFNTLLYIGLQTTTATNALLINSSIPVLIIAIGALVLREVPSRRSLAGITVSCIGVAWLISQGQFERLAALSFTTGDLWILTSSVVWAVYSLFLRFRPSELDPVAFLGLSASIGVVVLTGLGLWNPFDEAPMTLTPRLMSAVAFFAVFPSLLAYLCWNAGMARVGAARGGQMIHLMPVFGLALATQVLDETMAAHHWIGAALIASGLLIALLPVHHWRKARA
ncbi:EamA family transporter [Litorivicinus lipolyticus]|uniref:EamA family transporter n=1 Tax=Litorivicinus lipolyticus TaxID=418701 RepID=A0A5Q2QBH8_9GAMM|nr:DMT family transporter [Litorivicinus lipolyticus]QGG79661.1 EamA family transporter [Litorivicinus lipolyticus]